MTATTAVRDLHLTVPSRVGPHALAPDVVAAELGVDPVRGLTEVELAARREKYGPNRLVAQPPRPAWKVFGDQLRSGLSLILLPPPHWPLWSATSRTLRSSAWSCCSTPPSGSFRNARRLVACRAQADAGPPHHRPPRPHPGHGAVGGPGAR
ncbi:cation-transporting P-type ATPase [Nocardioides pyridinolyticus]